MFGGQILIIILDAWCLKMFLSGYGNLMSSSYGFTKYFAATMCLIGFCKITAKLDSYMASLGVNLGRIGGGLSGMGALLMAGRLLHMGGSGGRTGGGNQEKGASLMGFGTGKPIPTRFSELLGGWYIRYAEWLQYYGMNGGVNAEEKPEPGEDFGWHGAENEFDSGMPGTESANAPFGMPDESDFDAQEGSFDGMESREGMGYIALALIMMRIYLWIALMMRQGKFPEWDMEKMGRLEPPLMSLKKRLELKSEWTKAIFLAL